MDPDKRVLRYAGGPGRFDTPRQRRRRKHKLGHLAALERKGKLPPALGGKP